MTNSDRKTITLVLSLSGGERAGLPEAWWLLNEIADVYRNHSDVDVSLNEFKISTEIDWFLNILRGLHEKAKAENSLPRRPCEKADCKVAYWSEIVATGNWRNVAQDYDDARRTLASHELLCDVFHRPNDTRSKRFEGKLLLPQFIEKLEGLMSIWEAYNHRFEEKP